MLTEKDILLALYNRSGVAMSFDMLNSFPGQIMDAKVQLSSAIDRKYIRADREWQSCNSRISLTDTGSAHLLDLLAQQESEIHAQKSAFQWNLVSVLIGVATLLSTILFGLVTLMR